MRCACVCVCVILTTSLLYVCLSVAADASCHVVCEPVSVGVSSLPVFNQPFNQTTRSSSGTSRRKLSGFTG